MRPASGTQKFLEILIFRLFKEDRPLQKQGLTVDSFLSGFYNLNTKGPLLEESIISKCRRHLLLFGLDWMVGGAINSITSTAESINSTK